MFTVLDYASNEIPGNTTTITSNNLLNLYTAAFPATLSSLQLLKKIKTRNNNIQSTKTAQEKRK